MSCKKVWIEEAGEYVTAPSTPTDPETPQTAAGRALVPWLRTMFPECEFGPLTTARILAIEAEALSMAEPLIERAYEAGRAARDAEVRALREAALKVCDNAEADDNWEGEYVDFLVPADEINALRAILSDTPEMGS